MPNLRTFTKIFVCMSLGLGTVACSSNIFYMVPAGYQPLAYYQWLQSADAEALAQEQARLSDDGTVRGLVQTAMLTQVHGEDPQQTLTLLQNARIACNETGEAASRYCLLTDLLLSQNEAEKSLARDQADLATNLAQELAESEAEQEEMRQEIERMEEQIKALTNLEQQLIEREQSQVTPNNEQ